MKRNVMVQILKGIVLAYILSALALVILAFLMYQWDIPDSAVRGGILFSYVVSCFISGMAVSRQHAERKYLWGLLMGAAYFAILWIVSMIVNKEAFTGIPGIFPAMALCLLGGMLGGMLQAGRR